jgi:type IV pilus assembly protein PilC
MPTFKYKIKNEVGEVVETIEDAEDKYVLLDKLKKQEGKEIISIEEVKKSYINIAFLNTIFLRVKLQDKITFTKNLGAMLSAGLSLSRSLNILERQTKNEKFKNIIKNLSEEIRKGGSLSEGMGKIPKVFSSLFVSMVRAGEESGSLSESLGVIGQQLEKSYILKKKIKGAMLYPIIVISAMFIIGVLMLIYVVPTLTETFKELNVDLPASTKFIIFISDFLAENTLSAFLLIVSFIVAFIFALKTKKGKRAFEFLVLRIPVVGKIAKESNAARTTRTLSSLLSAGVDMVGALSITRDVLQNSYYKEVLKKAEEGIQKGIALSESFKEREDLYPILVGEMIEVGEETGKLSKMLLGVATFYESEVDLATKNISTVIEPFLMVVIGIAVGFFALSMITPMYSLSSAI